MAWLEKIIKFFNPEIPELNIPDWVKNIPPKPKGLDQFDDYFYYQKAAGFFTESSYQLIKSYWMNNPEAQKEFPLN